MPQFVLLLLANNPFRQWSSFVVTFLGLLGQHAVAATCVYIQYWKYQRVGQGSGKRKKALHAPEKSRCQACFDTRSANGGSGAENEALNLVAELVCSIGLCLVMDVSYIRMRIRCRYNDATATILSSLTETRNPKPETPNPIPHTPSTKPQTYTLKSNQHQVGQQGQRIFRQTTGELPQAHGSCPQLPPQVPPKP